MDELKAFLTEKKAKAEEQMAKTKVMKKQVDDLRCLKCNDTLISDDGSSLTCLTCNKKNDIKDMSFTLCSYFGYAQRCSYICRTCG